MLHLTSSVLFTAAAPHSDCFINYKRTGFGHLATRAETEEGRQSYIVSGTQLKHRDNFTLHNNRK